jgi:hypothetical protein
MATSVVVFDLPLVGATEPTKEVIFKPPSNIAGKPCYVKCSYIAWDFTTGFANNSRDCMLVYASWTQPLSAKSVPIGSRTGYRTTYTHGPVLCYIPEGPHIVRFDVRNLENGGLLAGSSTTTNFFRLVLNITPADSRQSTIG